MKKFFTLDKTRLTNGQHFTFITAFAEEIQAIPGAPARLQARFDALAEAQRVEDRYLKLSRSSDLTKKIREADGLRDENYGKLRDLIRLWAGSGVEPQATAAAPLLRVINTYRLNVSAQMDDESGLLADLIADLSATDMQANLKAIGADDLLANIRRGNEQVISLLKQRDEERSGKVVGALRKARAEADKAYAAATEAIEAYNFVQGGYDSLISRWNGTVGRYQDMLSRKTGIARQQTPSGDAGGTGDGDTATGGNPGGGDLE